MENVEENIATERKRICGLNVVDITKCQFGVEYPRFIFAPLFYFPFFFETISIKLNISIEPFKVRIKRTLHHIVMNDL